MTSAPSGPKKRRSGFDSSIGPAAVDCMTYQHAWCAPCVNNKLELLIQLCFGAIPIWLSSRCCTLGRIPTKTTFTAVEYYNDGTRAHFDA